MVRLFVTVGARDNVRPADLVGAIANRAGVASSEIGKVDVREISRQGDVAQVEVVDKSGRARSYRVVREGGVWKLDLDLPAADGGG